LTTSSQYLGSAASSLPSLNLNPPDILAASSLIFAACSPNEGKSPLSFIQACHVASKKIISKPDSTRSRALNIHMSQPTWTGHTGS